MAHEKNFTTGRASDSCDDHQRSGFRYASPHMPLLIKRIITLASLLVIWDSLLPLAQAVTFTNGNLLICTQNTVYEYTPAAVRMQSFPTKYPTMPYPGTEYARDVALDGRGSLLVYNGTFYPYLSTLNLQSGSWSHRTYPGWNLWNNQSYGGLACFGQYAFVTTQDTQGRTSGVIRFDTSGTGAVQFANGLSPVNLTKGLDGFLYTLSPNTIVGTTIDVYDPFSLAHLRSLDLQQALGFSDHRSAVAVNAAGDIYVTDWNTGVYCLDPSGHLLRSYNPHVRLADVSLAPNGMLVLGSADGDVFVTNENFSSVTHFTVGTGSIFVSIVPEPSAIFLLTVAPCLFACFRRPRRQMR